MRARHRTLAMIVAVEIGLIGTAAHAFPRIAPEPDRSLHVPVQMGLLELLFNDDDDGYVHDRHYDWNQYRNSTSRKERIRDYYMMQREAEKDYWRAQKNMQKEMVKRQRGW